MFHQSIVLSTNQSDPELVDLIPILADILPASFSLQPNNPDIKEIKRTKSSIGIADIQSLVAWNMQKPFQGEHKLGVIYEAERLTPEAQNSLLKTLEEPAPGTLICLVTHNRSSLLPTILSRSQHLQLGDIKVEDIGELNLLAKQFLTADLMQRQQLISTLTDSDDSREDAVRFVAELMRQLVANRTKFALPQLNRHLDIAKLAYLGLRSGTNIKLTLETLIISMSE